MHWPTACLAAPASTCSAGVSSATRFAVGESFPFWQVALAGSDGARAREMCIRLSDFLRGSLALGDRDSIPLSEELALARRYGWAMALGPEDINCPIAEVAFGFRPALHSAIAKAVLG